MWQALACLVALFLIPSATSAQGVVGGLVFGPIQVQTNGLPPRDAAPPATGRSTIRGRIVSADGGQAMRRATVRINAPELRGSRTTLTNAEGRYEFRDLPAGRYSINASKTAFLNWSYGQTQPASPGKPLVVTDNQTTDNIDIRLPRGAVITGRITDDFGEPAPNANIALLRQQFSQGQRRLVPIGGRATTNDIGEYRIFGVAPGQYYVSATMAQGFNIGPANQLEGPEARSGYAPTFYPGTSDVASAQKVTVGLSQTIGEINLVLLPTRLATVSGSAVDPQGRPLTAGGVSVMPRGGMVGLGGGGSIRSDGTFTVSNLAPGDYVLRANTPRPPTAPGTPPGPPEFSVAVVTVNGEDVTGVRLAPVVPATVSGHVSFDDSGAAQALKPSSIRVMTQTLNPDDAMLAIGAGPPPTLKEDFTFELKTAPGRIALRAVASSGGAAAGIPGGVSLAAAVGTPSVWQVKSIRVNGVDAIDTGIEVGAQGVRGIEIELTTRQQQVLGAVTDGRNGAVTDYVVVLFAQDRNRWTAAFNRYFAIGRPGNEGRFTVSALPPGEYYAIALDRADASQWQDPEFLEGLSRQASTFSLAQGETRTLELKLFTLQ